MWGINLRICLWIDVASDGGLIICDAKGEGRKSCVKSRDKGLIGTVWRASTSPDSCFRLTLKRAA
jgi:hypothetical protein